MPEIKDEVTKDVKEYWVASKKLGEFVGTGVVAWLYTAFCPF